MQRLQQTQIRKIKNILRVYKGIIPKGIEKDYSNKINLFLKSNYQGK